MTFFCGWGLWLRIGTGCIQKEDDDFLVRYCTGVDRSMHSRLGFVPLGQSRLDRYCHFLAGFAKLNA